jgi:hypothetical protein
MPLLILKNIVPNNWNQPYFPRAKFKWLVKGSDCVLEVDASEVEFFRQILPEVEVFNAVQEQKEEKVVVVVEAAPEPAYELEVEELITTATVAPE